MIRIAVYSDELVINLQQVPRKIRAAIEDKFRELVEDVQSKIHEGTPGKYLDPATIESGIDNIGDTVIGFIEAKDKGGKYPITPKVAPFLKFEVDDGRIIRTKLVMHPYPKSTTTVEQLLRDAKPWLEGQLTDLEIDLNG